MTSDNEPLVLLHGLGMSERVWDGVRPLLEPHHDVVALTTLGHRGGPPSSRRPVTVRELVDDTERQLQDLAGAAAHRRQLARGMAGDRAGPPRPGPNGVRPFTRGLGPRER
jgi:hypothetical protein